MLAESGESLGKDNFPSAIFNEFSKILGYASGVLANSNAESYEEAYTALETAMDAISGYNSGNVALGKAVTASSTLTSSYWGNEMSGARRRYYAISALGLARLEADLEAWKETKAQIDLLLEVE